MKNFPRMVILALILGVISRVQILQQMNNTNKQRQEDALIVVILLMVAGFGACSIFKGSSDDSESKGECYERVGQEIAKREGRKVITKSDMEYYYREFVGECGPMTH